MTLRPGTVTVTPNSPEAAPTESPPPEENHEDIEGERAEAIARAFGLGRDKQKPKPEPTSSTVNLDGCR
jgi:hypothetical protein